MIDVVQRISATLIRRYRKWLVGFAVLLIVLHLAAFLVGLVLSDSQLGWVPHLVNYSQSLLGFTGALLLLVLLSETVSALKREDEDRKRDVHRFIRQHLEEWFGQVAPGVVSIGDLIDDETFTDFKVQGDAELLDGGRAATLYASQAHFELTFYPTKLIYGLHFESSDPDVNEGMAEWLRDRVGLSEGSGFEFDRLIPKKPGWVFLIRTVPLTGKFEKDFAEIMTHARHFVELVGHTYEIVYSPTSLERYRELLDPSEVAVSDAVAG